VTTDLSFDRTTEVETLLREDETRIGKVFRHLEAGVPATEIADLEGWGTRPTSAERIIRVLRDGHVPVGPTLASQDAGRVRSWLRTKQMSPALTADFQRQLEQLEAAASNTAAQIEETEAQVAATERAEASGRPGIYVYTLPHYLRHPIEPETRKTLLKVGHSSVDALHRANAQARFTALPEDPILLRIYPAEESGRVEREFHNWLRDADHAQPRSRRSGTEWFVTSTKFLDRIARSLDLEIEVVVNDADWDDD
jgi:hypothetical protein